MDVFRKIVGAVFEKSGKNQIFGPILTVFGQNEAKNLKSQKSAWIGFLVLNVPYFVTSFGKIVGAVS